MSTITLPTTKQTRAEKDPLDARVMLAGTPKVGKTTLAASWAPDTTLIIDTHKGTVLLEGEHYVQHVSSWAEFAGTVDLIVAGDHPFRTVVIDLVDDAWKMADMAVADKRGQVAAGLIEYGKGVAEAEGLFRRTIGRLLAAPVGIWFVTHTETEENGEITRHVPKLDRRVKTFIQGACDFVWLAEAIGPKRRLHTQPSARFEAGSRFPMPSPMELDARAIYKAMRDGMKNAEKKEKK